MPSRYSASVSTPADTPEPQLVTIGLVEINTRAGKRRTQIRKRLHRAGVGIEQPA